MGFYEYLNEANWRNSALNYNMSVDQKIDSFLKQYDTDIKKFKNNLKAGIILARPNMGQTLSNWWKGIKDFGHKLWAGKWKEWDQRHVYDAKLYNLTETYANAIYNEANAVNIDQIIDQFTNQLLGIFISGMKEIAAFGLQKGKYQGYELAYADAKADAKREKDKPEPPEEKKPRLEPPQPRPEPPVEPKPAEPPKPKEMTPEEAMAAIEKWRSEQ